MASSNLIELLAADDFSFELLSFMVAAGPYEQTELKQTDVRHCSFPLTKFWNCEMNVNGGH